MLFMILPPSYFEYFFVCKNLCWKVRKRLASSLSYLRVTFACVVLFLTGKENCKDEINFWFFSPLEGGEHWCVAGRNLAWRSTPVCHLVLILDRCGTLGKHLPP